MKRCFGHGLLAVLCVSAITGLAARARSKPTAKTAEANVPLVQVGVKNDQTPVKLCGNIRQDKRGMLTVPGGGLMPGREPWGWVAVGPDGKRMRQLEGLRSLTICGWVRPTRRPADRQRRGLSLSGVLAGRTGIAGIQARRRPPHHHPQDRRVHRPNRPERADHPLPRLCPAHRPPHPHRAQPAVRRQKRRRALR